MNWMRHACVGLLCAALAACGGGGGSAGATSGGGTTTTTQGSGTTTGGTTTTTTEPKVASFAYQLSKQTITTSGSDSAVLTITALDGNNNPVKGVSTTVAVDSGIYTPTTTTTDEKGQVTGAITIGTNKANRNITSTMTVGGQTANAVVAVTGTQLAVTPLPATALPGAPVRVDLKVTDANGQGVAFVPVTLSGTLGLAGTVTTDASGNASSTLASAPAVGTYLVEAAGLGVKTTRSVQVIASGGGSIPGVTDPSYSGSLSIVPNTIAPNASGSTTNRAALKAKFLNATNQSVQNVRVRFELVSPALGSGEQISTGDTTVYSDSNGEAVGDYIAGTRSSPTNGVIIRACYGNTDASIAGGLCPNSVQQTLTVASQPLSIGLGDNNLLEKGNASLTYIKKFDVSVADSAGNPVAGAVVSASVDLLRFGKGSVTNNTSVPIQTTRLFCANEDSNRNGTMDVGEDLNNNGQLDPRKADVILSFVGSNVTGSNGRMVIQVEYAQNFALWLEYRVKVTTNVAGSEGTNSKDYVTSFVDGDQQNGSFLVSPYGTVQDCTQPN